MIAGLPFRRFVAGESRSSARRLLTEGTSVDSWYGEEFPSRGGTALMNSPKPAGQSPGWIRWLVSSSTCARSLLLQLVLLAVSGQFAWSQNACDLSQDGAVNLVDVQLAVNMALGLVSCTANINGSAVCNVTTVQRVINASLGLPCVTGAGPGPHTVTLAWTASTSPNVSGYNVYRGTMSGGPYTKVNTALVVGTSYLDTTVQAGQTYYYVATALDGGSNESAYSNQAQAVIPSP